MANKRVKDVRALSDALLGAPYGAASLGGGDPFVCKREEELWVPELSRCQLLAYKDRRPIVELDGERGSGKSHTACNIVARHVYDTKNALVFMYVLSKAAGSQGGIWDKLTTRERDGEGKALGVLQAWQDEHGEDMFSFSDPRFDINTHGEYVLIKNRYGDTCRVNFKAVPPGETVKSRTRGGEPTMIVIDEYNATTDPKQAPRIISAFMQQLGRRKSQYQDDDGKWKTAPQQLILCGNPPDLGPDDPSCKLLFVDYPTKQGRPPIVEVDGDVAVFVHNDDPYVGRWHVTAKENRWLDMDNYQKTIALEAAMDPTAEDRLIHGIWRKKQTGNGIFAGFWNPDIHIRPKIENGKGANGRLYPIKGEPIITGYDPGDSNNARVFMQAIWVNDGGPEDILKWRIFDEMIYTDQHLSIDTKVRMYMERRLYWCRIMGERFSFVDVADAQAQTGYNRFNDLGYEAKQHETLSRQLINTKDSRYAAMAPISIICPSKTPGTVPERLKILRDLLLTERIIVSRSCTRTIDMFAYLKKDARRGGAEDDLHPKRSKHIHTFDAVTYPLLLWMQNGLTIMRSAEELSMCRLNI